MNPLNNQNMQKGNQLKAMLQNPQIKTQIQQMYALWQGDQQGFINQMVKNNPRLNNNPILKSALSGQANPEQIFSEILGQYGMSESDFMSLLQ